MIDNDKFSVKGYDIGFIPDFPLAQFSNGKSGFNTKNLDWAFFSSAGVILASALTRKLMQGSYKKLKGKEPPKNPSSKHVTWDEAITWGIASGAVIGLARILAQEGTVKGYKKVFKKSPPR